MANRSLNLLDASWLLIESHDTPMHVGALMQFVLPERAAPDFVRQIMADFRGFTDVAAPWNRRVHTPALKGLLPLWTEIDTIDLEHHVHHSALPAPGGERELGQVIARLHSQQLDLTRPPWELELIEGLENRRFAIYIKIHHSLIDGVAGVRLLARTMSSSAAGSLKMAPFWTIGPAARARLEKPAPTAAQVAVDLIAAVRGQAGSVPNIARAFGALVGAVRNKADVLAVPFDAPLSVINGRIHAQRRFATQRFDLERLKRIAENAGVTLNDIVLALCGAALRRFLIEIDELPDKPLTAGIPMSVRPKDDEGEGNAITFIIATLGTDIADPLQRLAAINASTLRAKEHVQGLPRKSMLQYTLLLMAPYIISLLTGVGGRTRPMFNVTISNVPGPDKPLYFRGALMEASYPVSLVTHGQAINITCQSYAGHLHFGFTGCRDSLPHMQHIATYTGEALIELEACLVQVEKPAKQQAPRKPRLKPAVMANAEASEPETADEQPIEPAKRPKLRKRS